MIDCRFENGNEASLRHVTTNAVVHKGGKILLVKRHPALRDGGKWCLPGGFVDRDETIEQAIQREIHEETGWRVKNLVLAQIVSNPVRGSDDRQNVGFQYFAEATERTGQPDWESDGIQWFEPDQLPQEDQIAFDHAGWIALYVSNLKRPVNFPLVG